MYTCERARTSPKRAPHTPSCVSVSSPTWSRYDIQIQTHTRRVPVLTAAWQVWRETGFLWEQYNSADGKGKGCHPFTGWSALIAEIIVERYVRVG